MSAGALRRRSVVKPGFQHPRDEGAARLQAAEVARRLDLTLDAAIHLEVPEEVLVQRLMGRSRADDTAELIRHRLEVFAEMTRPLIAYYQSRGILIEIDGDRDPDLITAAIKAALDRR